MKALHLSVIVFLIIFLALPSSQYRVYAPLMIPPVEELFNQSAIIVVGHVTFSSEIPNGTRTEYIIQPQEYLKPASANDTQSIMAFGAGSENHDPYEGVYHVGDRVLFFLQDKNGSYFIMPYSILTKSDCNGEQLLALNYSPGDFSIKQGNNTIDEMITGEPINITGYAHNNFDLKPRDVEIDFTLHNTNPNLTLTEKRQVHIDECKGFAQSSWIFVPTVSGRYSLSVDSHDASGEHFGGAMLCCMTISNNSSSQPINTSQVSSGQTAYKPLQPSASITCCPVPWYKTPIFLIGVIAAAATGFFVLYFRHFKEE